MASLISVSPGCTLYDCQPYGREQDGVGVAGGGVGVAAAVGDGVGVAVLTGVAVCVAVATGVLPGRGVDVCVAVSVGTGEGVGVAVILAGRVAVAAKVGRLVSVSVGRATRCVTSSCRVSAPAPTIVHSRRLTMLRPIAISWPKPDGRDELAIS
jgi:hypothetical protein